MVIQEEKQVGYGMESRVELFAAMLTKRAPGYTSLGFPDPRTGRA